MRTEDRAVTKLLPGHSNPRHADPLLVHPGPEIRHRFPAILRASSHFFAGDAVNHPGGPADDRCVDDGFLAFLVKVTGRAVPAFPHPLALTF